MFRFARSRRRGISVVELLVVTAIIAILFALLLPAVQKIRAAADKARCANNLKQIGLALHHYHSAYQTFPPGLVGDGGPAPSYPVWGWGALILPNLEQDNLHRQLNVDPEAAGMTTLGTLGWAFSNELAALQTPLKVFQCPSDSGKALNDMRVITQPVKAEIARANYVGNGGNKGSAGGRHGIFCTFIPDNAEAQPIAIKDITDGTSTTLLAGERAMGAHFPGADPGCAGLWAGSRAGDISVGIGAVNGSTLYRMMDGFAGGGPATPFAGGGMSIPHLAFSSAHGGGCNFVFCDGSVRFLSQGIDWKESGQPYGTYNMLGDRADGLTPGDF